MQICADCSLLLRDTTMANYALNIMSLLQNATAREFPPSGEQSPPVETMCIVAGTDEGSAEARWWRGCPLALRLGEQHDRYQCLCLVM